MTKTYLSGPMTGIPEDNYPLFKQAAKDLRDAKYTIVSPVEIDDAEGLASYGKMLGRDVQIIMDECGAMVFLAGWEKSKGARLEAITALLKGVTDFAVYQRAEPDIGYWVMHVDRAWVAAHIAKSIL